MAERPKSPRVTRVIGSFWAFNVSLASSVHVSFVATRKRSLKHSLLAAAMNESMSALPTRASLA